MGTQRRTRRIGSLITLALIMALPAAGRAEVRVTVRPDRTEIGQDESLALKITVETDGDEQISDLSFSAPDFETVNEFQSNSTQMQTQLNEQGQLETQTKHTTEVTKILRPRRM